MMNKCLTSLTLWYTWIVILKSLPVIRFRGRTKDPTTISDGRCLNSEETMICGFEVLRSTGFSWFTISSSRVDKRGRYETDETKWHVCMRLVDGAFRPVRIGEVIPHELFKVPVCSMQDFEPGNDGICRVEGAFLSALDADEIHQVCDSFLNVLNAALVWCAELVAYKHDNNKVQEIEHNDN